MKVHIIVCIALLGAATSAAAQHPRVGTANGDVVLASISERQRLADRIPAVPMVWRSRVIVRGDSAQRIDMTDFEWRGRVLSVELDEEDARLFWDVKIVPDETRQTIVRYRVDAANGGILGIREFTGIRGVAAGRP